MERKSDQQRFCTGKSFISSPTAYVKTKYGFTVIELLLAITISALIFSLVFSLLNKGFILFRRHQQQNKIYQVGNKALTKLAQEIRCAFVTESNPHIVFEGSANSMRFFSNSDYNSVLSKSQLKEIHYFLEATSASSFNLNDNGKTVASGLAFVNFTYFNGTVWQNEWEHDQKNSLPIGVSIKLSFVYPESGNIAFERIVSTLVKVK